MHGRSRHAWPYDSRITVGHASLYTMPGRSTPVLTDLRVRVRVRVSPDIASTKSDAP